MLTLMRDTHSGRRVGRYEILCMLSSGGMAHIFLAVDRKSTGDKRVVILKEIRPELSLDERFVEMFLEEARITSVFNHPNIVVPRGRPCLAMEFVAGANLAELARACARAEKPLPVGFTLSVCREIAEALHYAHTFVDAAGKRQQIIHRDVAEKNIMVGYEGETKLLDFGIATRGGVERDTTTGEIKGTTGYMSPEQILGEPLDPRSDVFSLAIVLYGCLTGLPLFSGASDDVLKETLAPKILPPSACNNQVRPALDEVILKALARDRDARYATAREFGAAIEGACRGQLWSVGRRAELMGQLFEARRRDIQEFLEEVGERAEGGSPTSPLEPPPPPIADPTRVERVKGSRPRHSAVDEGRTVAASPHLLRELLFAAKLEGDSPAVDSATEEEQEIPFDVEEEASNDGSPAVLESILFGDLGEVTPPAKEEEIPRPAAALLEERRAEIRRAKVKSALVASPAPVRYHHSDGRRWLLPLVACAAVLLTGAALIGIRRWSVHSMEAPMRPTQASSSSAGAREPTNKIVRRAITKRVSTRAALPPASPPKIAPEPPPPEPPPNPAVQDLYFRAYAIKDSDPDGAIGIFREVLSQTNANDAFHAKAQRWIDQLSKGR